MALPRAPAFEYRPGPQPRGRERPPQILGCDPHSAARRGCGSRGTRSCQRAWPPLQSLAAPRSGALCRPPAAVARKHGLPGTRSPHWESRGAGDPALGAHTDAVRASTPQTPLLPRGDYKRFLGKLRTEGSGRTRRPACTCCGVGAQGDPGPKSEAQRHGRDQKPRGPPRPGPGLLSPSEQRGSGQRAGPGWGWSAGRGRGKGAWLLMGVAWLRQAAYKPGRRARGVTALCSRDRAPKDLSRAQREPLRVRVPTELSGRRPPPRSSRPP